VHALRRYAFRSQPEIGQWNCVQLANALLAVGLVGRAEAQQVLDTYSEVGASMWSLHMKLHACTAR
jgi:uncharacterized protein YdiU (UPF0061 family)